MSLAICSSTLGRFSVPPLLRTFVNRKDTDEMYSELAMQHYKNPQNVGSFDEADDNVGSGLVGAPACGDVMKLQIKVGEDGTITEAKFKTFGCGAAVASSSYATNLLKGKSLEEATHIKNTDISTKLSLPPVKLHCSVLAEEAIQMAIEDYKRKKGVIRVEKVHTK